MANDFSQKGKKKLKGTIEAGNDIYRIFVEDVVGFGVGLYTAMTGPNHPSGPGLNVLYGDGSPGTTFNTIRSYTSQTDYVQDTSSSPPFTSILLDTYGTTELIDSTGVRTIYNLPGPPETPDKLTITQEIDVKGTTFEDSYITVTTIINNNSSEAIEVGIRYLWDFQIGDDDGPTFEAISPDGSVLTNETEFNQLNFIAYKMVDNDINPNPPTFIVFGSATGPNTFIPPPNTPDLLQYTSWPNSDITAFDYTIDPNKNVSSSPINDSAVLYYFGHNQNNSLSIPGNSSISKTAALFAIKPGVEPPFINQTVCIETTKIFDSCNQDEERTATFYVPDLYYGIFEGCSVRNASCWVLNVSEPDNEGFVEAYILVNILLNLKVNVHGSTINNQRVIRFVKMIRLFTPPEAKVSCKVLNPSCECEQLFGNQLQCTIHAVISAMSKGIVYITIPFISSCDSRICDDL